MSAREASQAPTSPQVVSSTLVALALSLAAMGACGYRFGLSDQTQYLAHYVALRWPGSLEGDLYLNAFGALGSFLWAPLAAVPQQALPGACMALTALIALSGALLLMSIARSVSQVRTMGWGATLAMSAPAMALVVPKEQNYFGLVSLADVELTATLAVLPLVFASVALFVRGRVVGSLMMGVLAAPVHGQTAAYILAAWCAGVILCDRRSPARVGLAICVGCVGLLGVLWARGTGEVTPGSMPEYERLGMELYAPLIDLWSVPARSWLALLIVIGFGLCALPSFLRQGSVQSRPTRAARERLVLYAGASLAFPALGGGLLALGLDEPLLWRLMVPRSLMLAQIVSVILASVWAGDRIMQGGRSGRVGLCVLLGLIAWPIPETGNIAGGALGVLIIVVIVLGGRARPGREPVTGSLVMSLPLAVCLLVGALGWIRSPWGWVSDSTPGAWREAQRWAQEHTPEGSVFVTPPYLAGWRIGAHRATYGELRDGGLLFYSGEPALEWERRMRQMGMDSMRAWWWDVPPGASDPAFASLRARYEDSVSAHSERILLESGADYVVLETPGDPPWGEAVWSNEAFTVVRVSESD